MYMSITRARAHAHKHAREIHICNTHHEHMRISRDMPCSVYTHVHALTHTLTHARAHIHSHRSTSALRKPSVHTCMQRVCVSWKFLSYHTLEHIYTYPQTHCQNRGPCSSWHGVSNTHHTHICVSNIQTS